MSDTPARRYMHLDLDTFRAPPRTTIDSRIITDDRFPEIAALMVEAYEGTIDDEGGDLADALGELEATERGDYGEPLRQYWLEAVRDDGSAAAAVICTCYRDIPFVAFSFTSHRDVGRGLATTLIADVALRLIGEGETGLSLVVTVGNPAERIYERLGFTDAEWPASHPG